MLRRGCLIFVAWLFAQGALRAQSPGQQAVADEQTVQKANLKTDADALLQFFRKRTLPDAERPVIQALIAQLGAETFRDREKATVDLIHRGPVVAELLKQAIHDQPSLEVVRRAERCLQRIQEKDVAVDVPAAAARLVAAKKPAAAAEVMLAYIPFADNDQVADEVRAVLGKLAVTDGKPHPTLVAGLTDPLPVRRAAAGEALARANLPEQKQALRKLLADPEAFVRLRVALALAYAKEKDAIQVVIDLLPQLSLNHVWQAEDFLYRLAEGHSPPIAPPGQEEASRKKARDDWSAWWKDHAPKIDLAKLQEPARQQGFTLIVLLDMGKVMELGADNQPRWQVENLVFPLDVQLIGEDRLLVAEYHAARVTERNLKGEVKWEHKVQGPLAAQRLSNGNTFIVTDTLLLEMDKDDKKVFEHEMKDGEKAAKAMKLPNGEIAVLTSNARVLRLDAKGKELHAFNVSLGMKLFGGRIHMLPSGRVLIPHNAENKVIEYDARGKTVWEVAVDQPVAALRLPNGHTLVTTMSPGRGAVEFDRNGNEVWTYRTNTRVTRAIRR